MAFPRLDAVSALAFLARWPTAAAAQPLCLTELEQFLREQQHGWPERTAARIQAALGAESPAAHPLVFLILWSGLSRTSWGARRERLW